MRHPPPETFERTLAGLSQSALAAFVADLWAARGWETVVEPDGEHTRIVCTRAEEVSRILIPGRESIWVETRRRIGNRLRRREPTQSTHDLAAAVPAVDIVVSPGADEGVESLAAATETRLYDADSLYDLALYGLDRAEADTLFRRHLGHGLDVSVGPARSLDDRAQSAAVTPWLSHFWNGPVSGLHLLVAVLAVVMLVAALVAGGASLDLRAGGADADTATETFDDGSGATSAPTDESGRVGFADVDPFGTGPPASEGDDSDESTEVSLAPGLADSGLTNPDTLAQSHATHVDGRSYVWRVNYTEQSAGTVARASAVHRVQNASRYRVDVETTGSLATDPGQLVPRRAYADGQTRYVLSGSQVHHRPLESRDHYAGHAETALAALLHANESEVVGTEERRTTSLYVVSLSGSPDPDRQAYRGLLFVTPDGVVHVAEARWVDRESNATVSVRTTYDFAGEQTITPPSWVRSATEAPTHNSTTESSSPPAVLTAPDETEQ